MITKDSIAIDVARIGSKEFQRELCVNGTAERYCLLDELIETTMYSAMHQATHPTRFKNLSSEERQALIRFHDQVDKLYGLIPWRDPKVAIADIVENNDAMRQIRNAACECLRTLDVSFTTTELLDD